MNNNFKILACFTRSYDKYHNSDNLHLISSSVLIRDKINDNFLENLSNSYVKRKFIIIEVFNTNDEIITLDNLLRGAVTGNIKDSTYENDYLGYINLSFDKLLKLYSSKESRDYIKELFNYGNIETKTENQIYSQSLFIFHNITWSNIVFKFKINNIDISGGGTNTRHILTSSDITLNNYLNMFYNYNFEYITNLGYNTYKNEKDIMSSQIPLKFYRSYLEKIIEIYKLSPEDIFNKIKLLTESDIELSSNDSFIKIIANNLLISRDIIIQKMTLHYRNILIENIKKILEVKTSDRSNYSSKYNTLVSKTKIMSNKSKKILKKEKENIINSGLNLSIISEKMNEYDEVISELENKLAINQEELDKKINSLQKLSFSELFKQYEEIRHKINYGGSNQYIFSKYNRQKNIRSYSTNISGYKYYRNKTSINLETNDLLKSQLCQHQKILNKSIDNHSVNSLSELLTISIFTKKTNIKENLSFFHKSNNNSDNNYTCSAFNILKNKIMLYQKCRKYSTHPLELNKDINSSYDNLVKTNGLEYQLINYKNNAKNILLNNIKNIINENKINNNTQILIELEIHNYNMKLFNDQNNIWQDISNVNNELKDLFINSKDELIIQINHLKNKNLHSNYFNNLNVYNSFYKINQKSRHSICISKILSEVDETKIVSILLGKVLFIINNPKLEDSYATKIFNELGVRIKQLYFYNLYVNECNKRKNSDLIFDKTNYFLKDWKEENKAFVKYFEDELFCIMLGSFCIDWLRDANLLELDTTDYVDNKSTSYIKITEAVSIKVLNKTVPLHYPDKFPMIVTPKKYKKIGDREVLGGYLLNDELYEDEIIIKNSRLRTNSIILDKNIIYDTINNMGSVGYKINKDVLNFIYLYNDKFNLTLINSKHSLENNKDRKRKLYKRELADLESFKSKRFVQENILAIADIFENVDEFFIPVRLDYRGRIYCSSNYLNYQGTELAKSLLMFSKGEKFLKTDKDAINYLKIFGANCFGNKLDKKSANERIKWIDDNLENIINFDNGILIEKAESKLLFIAFCFEFKKFTINKHNDREYFITHLPIQLDATCNGYQHISMLGMDLDLNTKLNIRPSSWKEVPDDFYSLISALIKGYLKLKLDEKNDKYDIYKRLYDLDMHRSIIKKCIMTIPYNTTALQGIKYLRETFEFDEQETNIKNMNKMDKLNEIIDDVNNSELEIINVLQNQYDENISNKNRNNKNTQIWFKHNKNQNIKLELDDFKELYFILKHVLFDVAPSLHLISEYLKEISKICIKGNTFIPWVLPTGLIIRQSYITLKELRISPFNYSKYSFVLKTKDMNKIDPKKNVRALMPNLIHSLDAASLSLLIDKYFNNFNNNIKNIFAIHDCFSTTSNNMKFVLESLKLIYISIYSDKVYLRELDDNMVKHIKDRIDDAFDNDKIKYVTIISPDNKKIRLDYPDVNKILNKEYDISEYIRKSSYLIN
jgi:hypothetical protein